MKCVGEKCLSFWKSDGRSWCFELNIYLSENDNCKLPERIQEIKNDLLRRCMLFEELLEIDSNDKLEEMIKTIP